MSNEEKTILNLPCGATVEYDNNPNMGMIQVRMGDSILHVFLDYKTQSIDVNLHPGSIHDGVICFSMDETTLSILQQSINGNVSVKVNPTSVLTDPKRGYKIANPSKKTTHTVK